jgi:hypothetical protein
VIFLKKVQGNQKALLVFDYTRYKKEVKKSVEGAIRKCAVLIYKKARINLDAITFKDNPVRILNGAPESFTSDADRKEAVYKNIIIQEFKRISNSVYSSHVAFVDKNFEDSHIGIYYEHGVGSNWDGQLPNIKKPPGYSLRGSYGDPISSRSVGKDYSGIGNGVWVDLGGNIRKTYSIREGGRGRKFFDYVGEETKAYHWFSRAFNYNKAKIIKIFQNELKKANPLKKRFWRIAGGTKVFILGKD